MKNILERTVVPAVIALALFAFLSRNDKKEASGKIPSSDNLVENFDPAADIPDSSKGCFFILNAGMSYIEFENLRGTIIWFTSSQISDSEVDLRESLLQFHPILGLEPVRFDGSIKRVPVPQNAHAFSVNEDDGKSGKYVIHQGK
jgi:hypothetical protein